MLQNRFSLFVLLLLILSSVSLWARPIRLIVPYGGVLASKLDANTGSQNLTDDDTGFFGGMYAQWLNPRLFQVNTFVYGAPDINYAKLTGWHFSADAYLLPMPIGKFVVGGGYELIRLDLDTADGFAPAEDLKYEQTIQVPFARAGYSVSLRTPVGGLSVFPWVGAQVENIDGDVSLHVPDPNGPMAPPDAMNISESFSSSETQFITGVNLRADIHHFIQLQLKGRIALDDGEIQRTGLAMVNVFATRSVGLSYRVKYTETSVSTEFYNLLGLVYAF